MVVWGAATACAGRDDGGTPKSTGPVSIEHWNTQRPDHPESVARMAVLDAYAQRFPDRAIIVHGQNATQQTAEKITAAVVAGNPPNLAVFSQYFAGDLASTGGLGDVNELLKGDREWTRTRAEIYPKLLSANTWKGKLFGVPIYESYFNLYVNTAVLQQHSIPTPKAGWTWDDFLRLAKTAARPPDVWGYNSGWVTAHHRMWAGSNGGAFLNNDGTKVTLTAQENVDAVQFELDLLRQGLMRDGSQPYAELLPQGGVVFQFAVPARIPLYKKDAVAFSTVFYPVGPRNRTKRPYTTGNAYAFSVFAGPDTDRNRAAAQAAQWAATREGQTIVARESQSPPASRALVESVEFKQAYSKDEQYWPFIEVLPDLDPYPTYPKYQESYDTLTRHLTRVWKGEATPREAMTEAERQIQQLLDASLRS